MSKTVTLQVPREFSGTLRSILEKEGRTYRSAASENTAGEEVRRAWESNSTHCFALAAQLPRT